MAKREIFRLVRGRRAVDGAGVHLVRVLGNETTDDCDPFLMLDSFDSTDPADYGPVSRCTRTGASKPSHI